MERVKKVVGVIACGLLVLLVSVQTASADVIFTIGNNPQPDENVLLDNNQVGNPIFGETNTTALAVKFLSNELLTAPSNGQARVEAVDESLTQLEVSIPGGSFLSLIFNLDADGDGYVDFTAVDTDGGVFHFDDKAMGNGANFFTFTAINGQRIASVSFLTDVPVVLNDAEQFRIGGAQLDSDVPTGPPATIPEPVSLVLLGSGLVGCAARMKRSRRK